MAEQRGSQTITSTSDRQKSVPVVTVESFYNLHAEKLQMKLEGQRVGFHRKIREPRACPFRLLHLFRRETRAGAGCGRVFLFEKFAFEAAHQAI